MASPEPSWLQRLLLEAVLLAAMVGVLAVTLSRWSGTRRNRGGNVEEGRIALELPAMLSSPAPLPAATVESEPESAEHEIEADAMLNDEQTIDHAEYEEIELRGDPLMEVNAYLAYGYHEKAREVLTEFIKENTAHAESRLLMLRVLHTLREKRTFRRHAEALLELVDGPTDERWVEAVRLGCAILPEERLFNADDYRRADDDKWEETVWTGTRPELTDGDDHIYLDIDEFKYVDLFLQDGTEAPDDGSETDPSIDAAAEPEDTEAELARWRAKMLGTTEDRGISLDLDEPGHEPADDEQP